ncbi:PspC domain-containing protein [Aquimarina sp. ERC-38]|uniref:PspC domain-containing protein n=1 Tax=Aquimarina sp. ERC-38 TaxID=2949996 RepID=UPI00224796C5|nr:PspC domain-containing protein [Aquimarina sp. ERC-38]UZO80354.1 PspC domain-containing protein [Aquimarina sp. ERC-38]
MNKTVNINLAGIFFHIDEDAYAKLQRYLEAVKRSFTDSEGRDEIIADIEARIAELFNEKVENSKQVIGNKEVDEVIAVMGQPEDYRIDEEIFEEETTANHRKASGKAKQLFRDPTNSYIGGVSSGLGHYIGIDPIWIRLAWIFLTLSSGGGFILIYIALWIFVPEAKSTADFLAMKGEAVNISNIEKKIKEGFNGVADKMKDVDYQKYGNKVKSGSTSFFNALTKILVTLSKVIVKLVSLFLIFIAGSAIIGLLIVFISIGIFGWIENPMVDYITVSHHSDFPLWLVFIFIFLITAIPFFFLLVLGLKILFSNLKSIGSRAKMVLLGIWILSVIGLSVYGIVRATGSNYEAKVESKSEVLDITAKDTLIVRMNRESGLYNYSSRGNKYKIRTDDNNTKWIIFNRVNIRIQENYTGDKVTLKIIKNAEGRSYKDADQRAQKSNYSYQLVNNQLLLDAFATTEFQNRYRNQEVEVILAIPEGTTLYFDQNTRRFTNSYRHDGNYVDIDRQEEQYLKLQKGIFECLDCNEKKRFHKGKKETYVDVKNENEKTSLLIDEDGVNLEGESAKLKINEDGVRIQNEEMELRIDENGIRVITK